MNVSELLRQLVGHMRPSHRDVVQLKVGDVVRGTVVKVLSSDQALVNINGTVITAQLQTPLKSGDVTLLQVQPQSNEGLIVLKPLHFSRVALTSEALADLIKQFGLNNSALERQLIQQMHLADVPLDKHHVQRLAATLSLMPNGADGKQWIQAAIIALQRGVPLTEQSIQAIQQVLFGQPLDAMLKSFQAQLAAYLQQEGQNARLGADAAMIRLLQQVQQHVSQLSEPLFIGSQVAGDEGGLRVRGDLGGSGGSHGSHHLGAQGAGQVASRVSGQMGGHVNGEDMGRLGGRVSGEIEPVTSQASGDAGRMVNQVNSVAGRLGSQVSGNQVGGAASNTLMHATVQDDQSPAPSQSQNMLMNEVRQAHQAQQAHVMEQANHTNRAIDGNVMFGQSERSGVVGRGGESSQAQAAVMAQLLQTGSASAETLNVEAGSISSQQGQQSSSLHWLTNLLKLLGVEHEHHIARLPMEPGDALLQNQSAWQAAHNNVKSLLLQLTQTYELPEAMRQSAEQLLQHITGQQLFMSTDRSSQFIHLTMFIPMFDEDGTQTAAINIQSRKHKNGQIDPQNCKIVFDLDMPHLGHTVIDVQVVNNVVSLHIHNDHPFMAPLLEQGKSSMTEAMKQVGYQLSSLTHTPFPKEEEVAEKPAVVKDNMYYHKPYRGLDVLI